jgi:hypothetical protein
MNSSVKRILLSSLAAGILSWFRALASRARASSLPPHLVLFGFRHNDSLTTELLGYECLV